MNTEVPNLTALQQTLRAVMLSMASACGADMSVLAQLLSCASASDTIAPEASACLRDLAFGCGTLTTAMPPH